MGNNPPGAHHETLARGVRHHGRSKLFEFLRGAVARDESALSYAQIAAQLNLTEAAVKMAVQRLRARYREILRSEIVETVSSPDEVEEEIRHLFSAFGP